MREREPRGIGARARRATITSEPRRLLRWPAEIGLAAAAIDVWLPGMVVDTVTAWLSERGLPAGWASALAAVAGALALLVCCWLAHLAAQRILLRALHGMIQRSTFLWDDVLQRSGVFRRLAHFVPALVVSLFASDLFVRSPRVLGALRTGVNLYLVMSALLVLDALLDAVVDIYNQRSTTRRVPLRGFAQGAKLISFLLGGVMMLSLVLGRSPIYLLSGLGALTAVLLLVFKDALLGLVAGVQISVNRMVQTGDWIEMDKYGADGDVIDVGLTTVKVQNWDKTITTVPTYALISDPVKNWRGMVEAGGRRIKRAIYLDTESFRFVDDALLERLKRFRLLRPYLERKLPEIAAWNASHEEDLSVPVNGRRLTNIGCYRAYAEAYVRAHPLIHGKMTLLVRQLEPTDRGLPLEIYAFTSDTSWATYEAVQADLFDHLLTIVPEFDLRVFQLPSGHAARSIGAAWLRGDGPGAESSVRSVAAVPAAK